MGKKPESTKEVESVEVVEVNIPDAYFDVEGFDDVPFPWEMSRQPNIYIDDIDFVDEE